MIVKQNIITNKTPNFDKQAELDSLEIELTKAFDAASDRLMATLGQVKSDDVHEQTKRN